jgi:hypothetical protein
MAHRVTASARSSNGKSLREPMETNVDLDQKQETTTLAQDILSLSLLQARLVDLKLPIKIAERE